MVTRRRFLTATAGMATVAAAPMIACRRKSGTPLPPGTLAGSDAALGHRLREGGIPEPAETRRTPVLIVGGGIGGLSAAWQLQRAGLPDFILLELEAAPGGNARWGENAVSAYPLGAHYLPLPTAEATDVRALLADLGALKGDPQAARPEYDETWLCHAPHERVYLDGFWEEGLLPKLGASREERAEFARFHDAMAEFKVARDLFGRRAFALPVVASSRDARWRALDGITMADWLIGHDYRSPRLHAYVDYACRDDYGTDYRQTSAWAGIHYFACRNGEAANAASDTVLTAPEGNGWIVRRLAARMESQIRYGAAVFRLAQDRAGVSADVWLEAERRSVRYGAEQLIWAAPLFLLPKLATGLPPAVAAVCAAGTYAPWLVANLTLREPPAPGAGAPLAWDNVLFDAPGLGYVMATHQQLHLAPGPTVMTYYRALADRPPAEARQLLLDTSREAWAAAILDELSRAHRELPQLTARLDVYRHGHAMIRPLPGVVGDEARAALARGWGRVRFAHADLSGLSLFEEANYRGVAAARAALTALGRA